MEDTRRDELMAGWGGHRHGWKRSSIQTRALHVYIKQSSHQELRLIAETSQLSMGEVVDKLIQGHMRRIEKRMSVPLKNNALPEATDIG